MKRRLQLLVLLLAGLSAAALLAGCGDSESTPPEPATVDDGWRKFESGDYAGAISIFNEVLAEDSEENDARNGLGWAFAYSGELGSAKEQFETAIGRDSDLVDSRAGLSAVLLARGDTDGAITHASEALDLGDAWSFAHATGVDQLDLHLILAQAYFRRGGDDLAMAQAEADILDPSNDLDPAESSTWNGQPTYAAALLKLIQEIEESVGSEMFL